MLDAVTSRQNIARDYRLLQVLYSMPNDLVSIFLSFFLMKSYTDPINLNISQ